jgi:hypothetical protein
MPDEKKEDQVTENLTTQIQETPVRTLDVPKREWEDIIDNSLNRVIDVFQERQRFQNDSNRSSLSLDKLILLVIGIALMSTLLFTFYMIAIDKLTPVTQVLYPILTALLGFMSGYFAGSGRKKYNQR